MTHITRDISAQAAIIRCFALVLLALMLCSCKNCDWQANQEKRHQYFMECLKAAGRQPEHNHEDNNGDLVKACENAAYYQSQEKVCND